MTTTPKTNSGLPAIIFAVFAAVCIAGFLSFRGGDVGQLPKLVGNLGGGPLFGDGMYNLGIAGFISLLLSFSWTGFGFVILRIIQKDREINPWMIYPLRAGTGALAWSIVWFFLGIFGLYSTPIAVGLLVIGLAFAAFLIVSDRRKRKEKDEREASSWTKPVSVFPMILPLLLQLTFALAFVSAVAPPTAKDALLYHFALPKAFIAQGANGFVDGNIASYLALGTEMHSVWAMLLGNLFGPAAGEATAGATICSFFAILVITIYRWARSINLSPVWAFVAQLLVAATPSAYHVASSGYIDLSLALYVTLATYALTRWWKEQTWGWVILIAIFLGAALSIKLTTVFVMAAFALVILLRGRENGKDTQAGSLRSGRAGKIVTTGFAALLLSGVIASPWYIRTWAATGSPVFPFYMSIWPGRAAGWDVERSNLFQAMNSQYGGTDVDKVNYLTAPVRVSVAAQPEQPANYDGVLGVAFLIGLPLLIWALWKFDLAVEVKIMAGVAAVMYLFWLFSSEQLRYLLPIAPLLAIAIVASAEKIGGGVAKVAQYAFIAASFCGLLTIAAWFCQKAPLRVALGGETRDQYLTRNLDYYPYYQTINTDTAPDAKIWLINMRRDTYNIERSVFSDYLFEDWTLRKMVWDAQSVQELRTKTAAMGVQYVLTRHDFLFDFDKSTLVDDKRSRAENEAKLKIAKDFILDPTNTVRADNKFSLIKVF